MLGGEEFLEEQLEFLQLVVLSNTLLTTDQLIYPFVVFSPLGLVLLQFVPNALEGGDVDLDLVAEFVNESEQVEHLCDYIAPVHPIFVVLD